MILVIDAGNTNITIGVYQNDDLLFTSRLATDRTATADRIAIDIMDLFELNSVKAETFSGAAVSSVVPELNNALMNAVTKLTGHEPVFVGPGIKTGLNIRVDDPAGLGADLVSVAVAAKEKYALPCLIADLGTATKVIALGASGEFLGCTIAPGVAISLNALANGASQLTTIRLKAPDHVIGTNTVDSMTAGLVYGTIDSLDGTFDRMEQELKLPIQTFVATGGLCDICKDCRHDMVLDKNLVLDGLKLIYDRNPSIQ